MPRRSNKPMRRGQKWTPAQKYTPKTLACIECALPSYRGLPPFIAVTRLVDGEKAHLYRHATCPSKPGDILKYIKAEQAQFALAREAAKGVDRASHRNRRYNPPRT